MEQGGGGEAEPGPDVNPGILFVKETDRLGARAGALFVELKNNGYFNP